MPGEINIYDDAGVPQRKITLNSNNQVEIQDSAGTPIAIAEVLAKYRKASATGVAIGVSGSPASIITISATTNHSIEFRKATVTPSGLATGETVTYHVIFSFSDGTTAEVATISGVSAATDITMADIDWNAVPDGAKITQIEITAESSATSTTATSDATISALEL